jgi:molybdopterin-guanine dinucleotide biosynthesis protein A
MPFASLELFANELSILRETGVDAVIPRSDAGLEPFHAIYRSETCLPHVRAALETGKRRVDSWFGRVNIRYMAPDEIRPYDPDRLAFLNINTHDELMQAEEIARRNAMPEKPG